MTSDQVTQASLPPTVLNQNEWWHFFVNSFFFHKERTQGFVSGQGDDQIEYNKHVINYISTLLMDGVNTIMRCTSDHTM